MLLILSKIAAIQQGSKLIALLETLKLCSGPTMQTSSLIGFTRLVEYLPRRKRKRSDAKMVTKLSYILNAVLSVVLIGLAVALIQTRNEDTIRFTVTSADIYGYDLAPTVSWLQKVTGKEAVAYPLNGNEVTATKWRLQFEDRKS
jgi:hypothetical protein